MGPGQRHGRLPLEQDGHQRLRGARGVPLLKQGIRINAILPGPTDTPLARANAETWLGFGADYREEVGIEPSTPLEQAYPLVFLCSDAGGRRHGHHGAHSDAGYFSGRHHRVVPAAPPRPSSSCAACSRSERCAPAPPADAGQRVVLDVGRRRAPPGPGLPGLQALVHPPVPICPACRSRSWAPTVVSGRATVVGFTVNHHQWLPGFEPPYVIANVALAEDPTVRLTTNIVGCDPDDVHIGQEVQVRFEQHEDVWLPLFEPTGATDPSTWSASRPAGAPPAGWRRSLRAPAPCSRASAGRPSAAG